MKRKAPKKIEYRPMPCCVCGELCDAEKEVICFDLGTGETAHMQCRDKK